MPGFAIAYKSQWCLTYITKFQQSRVEFNYIYWYQKKIMVMVVGELFYV